MSNTWDYRFAFRIEKPDDVPIEFRSVYERLLELSGLPIYGLFSPAVEDSRFFLSQWVPPRLILTFEESLAVLTLDRQSNQVQTFGLNRQGFLGYGLADFVLNCWFILYPGVTLDSGLQIRFPSRASQHYVELARLLVGWAEWECKCDQNHGGSAPIVRGLPPKFANYLETHSEFGPIDELFFQPALEFRKARREQWGNLLLAVTPKGIVALSDQFKGETSPYGIELIYLPMAGAKSVAWCQSSDGRQAAIELELNGVNTSMKQCWRIFPGLSCYALRWVDAVKARINTATDAHECLEEPQRGGGFSTDMGFLVGRNDADAKSRGN